MKTSSLIILLVACVAFYIVKKYCYKLTVKPKNSLAEILEQRYSGYSFDPKKQVTQEQIKLLIRAAQLAPSSYNEQPWNFIICDKTLHPEAYNKAFNTLAEGNQKWAQNAQILVIIAASINSLKNNETQFMGPI